MLQYQRPFYLYSCPTMLILNLLTMATVAKRN